MPVPVTFLSRAYSVRATVWRTLFRLIPVPVTGIQQRRVCGAEESFQTKDLGWLDSCDKHRNEVGRRRFAVTATDEVADMLAR
ncbi:hypothetical protein ILFOPFJJ_03515 [Ensifer psoraleae]|nr:hypothetical protein [Sinorhizobium psoraleae]